MKRSNFAFLSIILLVFAAGCSSPTVTNPTPQVNYQSGQVYIYYAQVLNNTTGDTTAGSGDTIRSVVVATGISYQGMTGVTEIQNTHTNPPLGSSITDTTYIAQSNGNYYHYDYGLESINDNPFVLNVIKNPVEAGWILQGRIFGWTIESNVDCRRYCHISCRNKWYPQAIPLLSKPIQRSALWAIRS